MIYRINSGKVYEIYEVFPYCKAYGNSQRERKNFSDITFGKGL